MKYKNYPTNGNGERIYNPEAYYRAVAEDRYGFRESNSGSYSQGYSQGYSDGYSDGCDDGYNSYSNYNNDEY